MENSVVVKLQYPVVYKDVTVSEVMLRRVKGKDLHAIPDFVFNPDGTTKNPALYFPLIASMSGLDPAVIEEMDLDDVIRLIEAATPFLSKSPATGVS